MFARLLRETALIALAVVAPVDEPEHSERSDWQPKLRSNEQLYEALALLDAVRGGRGRERAIALKELTARLG